MGMVIESLPNGFITQVSIGDPPSPIRNVWGGTIRECTEDDLATMIQATLDDPEEPAATWDAAIAAVEKMDASYIHRHFYFLDGEFRARRAEDRGKVYYPDADRFILPEDRGTGELDANVGDALVADPLPSPKEL